MMVFLQGGWQNAAYCSARPLGCNTTLSAERLLVISTCPDTETAERIARVLVDAGVAACVNILPGVCSVYEWQGGVEQDAEVLLFIKTTQAAFQALETLLLDEHPYELPELIAVPIVNGSKGYLEWLSAQISST